MGNKDERTFTDIFASAKKEDDTNTQVFEEAINTNSIEENTSKDTTSITFDNLFDKMEMTDELETTTEEETLFNNFNPISFENTSSNVNFEENNNQESFDNVSTSVEAISKSTTTTELPNPFFREENIEENTTETANTSSNSTVSSSLETLNEEQTNLVAYNNPFFTLTPKEVENTSIEQSPQEENNNKLDLSINPFINVEISTETATNELAIDNITEASIINDNPFFTDTTTQPETTSNVDVNPFFSDTPQPTSEDSVSILNTNKTVEEPSQSQPEETTVKSTSPFFQEEQKSVENPFFQNQINLIENQVPNTPNSSIDTTKSKHYNVKVVKKKEPLIKVIIGVLSYALFIWLLLIGITLLAYVLDIKIRAAKGDYSSPTFNAYVVLTGSMLPDIQVYDVVVTKKTKGADLKEGDVITFASADTRYLGTIITHRIIKKNPPTTTEGYTFQTKGDNNNVADNALVPENNIYGKVILKIPKLGYLQEFLASDGGWIIVILIPCLAVMSYDIVKLITGIKRKKYKNIKVQK